MHLLRINNALQFQRTLHNPMKGAVFDLLTQPHLLYILNAVRCPYVRTSVTLVMASSVTNDVIMRMAGLVAGCERRRREPRE